MEPGRPAFNLDFEVSYGGAQLIQHLVIQDPVALDKWSTLVHTFLSSLEAVRKIKDLETDTDRIRRTLEIWISEKGSGATLASFVHTMRAHGLERLADETEKNALAIQRTGTQHVWIPGPPKAVFLTVDGRSTLNVGVATRMGAPTPSMVGQSQKPLTYANVNANANGTGLRMGKFCRNDLSCANPRCWFNHTNRPSCPYDRSCYNPNCLSNHSTGVCNLKPVCMVDGCLSRHSLAQKQTPGLVVAASSPASSRAPSPTPGLEGGDGMAKVGWTRTNSPHLLAVSGLPRNVHHSVLREKVQALANRVGGRVQYVRNGEAYITCLSADSADQTVSFFNGQEFDLGNQLSAKRAVIIPFIKK